MSDMATLCNWEFRGDNGQATDLQYFVEARRGAAMYEAAIDCMNAVFERMGFQAEARSGDSVFIIIETHEVEALRIALHVAARFGQPLLGETVANAALAQKYIDAGFETVQTTTGSFSSIYLPPIVVSRFPLP